MLPYCRLHRTLSLSVCFALVLATKQNVFQQKCGHGRGYDFIIVGGGTAGTALATRLSQRLQDCMLLLEAGPEALEDPRIEAPGMLGSTLGSQYDWNLTTIPQHGIMNRSIPQSRAKVLGGSQTMNFMVWDKASSTEYVAWEELGNPGWDWQSMSQYMHRSENLTIIDTESKHSARGVGFIQAAMLRFAHVCITYFVPTMENLGIVKNSRSLDGDPLGVMDQPSNVDLARSIRSHTANSYLPLAGRNLHVQFKERDGKLHAWAVQFNGTKTVKAGKEVIISGGALLSPALLERSGIGRAEYLHQLGIDQLLDLPGVGENLQDHITISTVYQLDHGYNGSDRLRFDDAYAAEQLRLWKAGEQSVYDGSRFSFSFQTWKQAGADYLNDLANIILAGTSSVVGKMNSKYVSHGRKDLIPQVEVMFADGFYSSQPYPTDASSPGHGRQYMSLMSVLQPPLSRGTVHINSSSFDEMPVIDPRYLTNEYDVEIVSLAARNSRKIANTYPLRQAWVAEHLPGQEIHIWQGWRKYGRENVMGLFDSVGTCAMLPQEDGGVVDPSLLVYGTHKLRFVDASIMPIIPSGHIQTAMLGVAQKAADIIVDRWKIASGMIVA